MKIFIFFLLYLLYNSQTISDSDSIALKLSKIITENAELKKNYEELKKNYDDLKKKYVQIYELKKNYKELKNNYEELKDKVTKIDELKKNNDELNQKVQNLKSFIDSRKPLYRLWNGQDHIYCYEDEMRKIQHVYRYEGIWLYAFTS